MREIKFRAWYKGIKKMVDEPLIEGGWKHTSINRIFARAEKESNMVLMQFTGLHDKNGKEIFEGDVYRLIHEGRPLGNGKKGDEWREGRHVVKWLPDGACFTLSKTTSLHLEVIGNIYENPELLK